MAVDARLAGLPLELVTVPCLETNYAYLLHDAASGQTAVVDVPDAAPVMAALDARGWRADLVLLTHHHPDHVQGVAALRAAHSARVAGAAADAHRLPPLDTALHPGDTVQVGAAVGHVLDVPGHTVGHTAFHFPASRMVFCADSLMACGCGRLFEGTPDQMHASLSRLAALPADTLVCSGHEYTAANIRFALSVDPDNAALQARAADVAAARAQGLPTVPSTLALECATNPFLRADQPALRRAAGLPDAPVAQVFGALRAAKDRF